MTAARTILLLALAAGINLLLLALVQQLTRHETRAVLPPAAAFPLELLEFQQRPAAPPPAAEPPPPPRPSKPPPPVPPTPQPAAELPRRAPLAQPPPPPDTPALDLPRLRAAGTPYLPPSAPPLPPPEAAAGPPLVPTVNVPPQYPPYARSAGLEGKVSVEFLVSPEGRVTELRIVRATPPEVFDQAVLRAVRRWRFDPDELGGQSRRMQQEIVFRLED